MSSVDDKRSRTLGLDVLADVGVRLFDVPPGKVRHLAREAPVGVHGAGDVHALLSSSLSLRVKVKVRARVCGRLKVRAGSRGKVWGWKVQQRRAFSMTPCSRQTR